MIVNIYDGLNALQLAILYSQFNIQDILADNEAYLHSYQKYYTDYGAIERRYNTDNNQINNDVRNVYNTDNIIDDL